jgi:DNA-binding CsgD family transcriptional regulator
MVLMNIHEIAERVSSLQGALLNVLAHMSEGLSNRQIAAKLGYSNAHVVATYVSLINKVLGLTKIPSVMEKRYLAVEAFRKSRVAPVKVRVSIGPKPTIDANTIRISEISADQIRSLLEKGYQIEAVELVAVAGGHAVRVDEGAGGGRRDRTRRRSLRAPSRSRIVISP